MGAYVVLNLLNKLEEKEINARLVACILLLFFY